MLRCLLLLFFCCLLYITGYAQQTIKAVVYENKSRVPLGGIRIQNLRTKQRTESEADGKFTIKASLNDILVFNGFAYQTDTVMVTDVYIKAYFMEPQANMLKEVKVETPEIHTGGGGFTDPDFHGQTMVYQRNGNGSYKGGVAFRLHYWKKDEKKREKLQQKAYEETIRVKMDKIFNDDTLMKFLPLKKTEVAAFITLYIPSAKVYMANNFNLLYYLDNCYKQFMKLPPEKRVMVKLVQ
ncbi:MAG: hypothetical protein V4592_14010 [Bacteroidota bacterium]